MKREAGVPLSYEVTRCGHRLSTSLQILHEERTARGKLRKHWLRWTKEELARMEELLPRIAADIRELEARVGVETRKRG